MGISRIEVIIPYKMVDELLNTINDKDFLGATLSHVIGCGREKGHYEYEAVGLNNIEVHMLPKQMVTLFVETDSVDNLIEKIKKTLYTGHIGDGKIFVSDVSRVTRVRTGEEGVAALK